LFAGDGAANPVGVGARFRGYPDDVAALSNGSAATTQAALLKTALAHLKAGRAWCCTVRWARRMRGPRKRSCQIGKASRLLVRWQ